MIKNFIIEFNELKNKQKIIVIFRIIFLPLYIFCFYFIFIYLKFLYGDDYSKDFNQYNLIQ